MRKSKLVILCMALLIFCFTLVGCKAKEATITFNEGYSLDKIYDGKAVAIPTADDYTTNSTGEVVIEWYEGTKLLESAPIDSGEYLLKLKVLENKKFLEATCELEFKITKILGAIEFNEGYKLDKIYDGKEVKAPTKNDYTTNAEEVIIEWYKDGNKITSLPKDVGSYKVKLIAKESKNFTSASCELEFKISKDEGSIKFKDDFDLNKVYDGEKVLAPTKKDYITNIENIEIEWYEGTKKLTEAPKDAGSYKVKIIAKASENFTGAEDIKEFTISKSEYSVKFKDGYALDKTYDGKAIIDPVKANYETNANEIKIEYYEGEIKLDKAPIDAGSYKVKLIAEADKNHTGATAELAFSISKADGVIKLKEGFKNTKEYDDIPFIFPSLANLETTATELDYEIRIGSTKLTSAPKDAGTYKLTIIGLENKNYKACETEFEFTITKIAGEIKFKDTFNLNKTYDGEKVNNPVKEDYTNIAGGVTYKWYQGTTQLTSAPKDAGTYKLVLRAAESVNYLEATCEYTFTISKGEGMLEFIPDYSLDKEYDGKAIIIKDTDYTTNLDDITIEYYMGTTKLDKAPENSGKYKVKLIGKESKNYTGKDIELEFTIDKYTNNFTFSASYVIEKTYDGLPAVLPTDEEIIGTGKKNLIKYEWYLGYGDQTKLNNAPTDAGEYTLHMIIYEDTNIYRMDVSTHYTINKADTILEFNTDLFWSVFNKNYNGIAPKFENNMYTVNSNGEIDIQYKYPDGTIKNVTSCEVGEYIAIVKVKEAKNFKSGEFKIAYIISKAFPTFNYYGPNDKDYDGKPIEINGTNTITTNNDGKRSMQITCGETIIKAFDNETMPEIINAGTYTIEIRVAESKNYRAIKEFREFTINKGPAGLIWQMPDYDERFNKVYDGVAPTLTAADIDTNSDGELTFIYMKAETHEVLSEAPKDAGKYLMQVKQAETSNYEADITPELDYEIRKQNNTINFKPGNAEKFNTTYNGMQFVVDETWFRHINNPNPISIVYLDKDQQVLPNKPINAGSYFVRIEQDASLNVNGCSLLINLTINKATTEIQFNSQNELSKVYDGTPIIHELDYAFISMGGQDCEIYYYNKSGYNFTPDESRRIPAPTAAGDYYIEVISLENNNYLSGFAYEEFSITAKELSYTYTTSMEYNLEGNYYVTLKNADINQICGTDEIILTLSPKINGIGEYHSNFIWSNNFAMSIATANTNYNIKKLVVILNITKINLNINAKVAYNDSTNFTYRLTANDGLINNEDITVDFTLPTKTAKVYQEAEITNVTFSQTINYYNIKLVSVQVTKIKVSFVGQISVNESNFPVEFQLTTDNGVFDGDTITLRIRNHADYAPKINTQVYLVKNMQIIQQLPPQGKSIALIGVLIGQGVENYELDYSAENTYITIVK